MTNAERHAAAIPLITESLRGNRNVLGDLMMLFRPIIAARVYRFLSQFGMDQHTDDVVQEVFIKIIKDFRLFIPRPHMVAVGFQAWSLLVTRNTYISFIDDSKNRLARREIPLVADSDDEGELKASTPADKLSLAAWEQESTQGETPPPPQSRRSAPRRYYNRTHKPEEKPPPPKKKRHWKKKTSWEVFQINQQRAAYLNDIEAQA